MKKTIDVSFTGGKKMQARVGDKSVCTDLPPQMGGDGTAPEPFTLFMMSIATCAGIYALNFCDAREIPTDNMALQMHYDINVTDKRVEKLHIDLKLPDAFPEKYKNAILKAIDLCTVKRHMMNPPEFIINAS